MPGPLHRIARWLRLVLAFLTVAGASVPAHALAATEAAVPTWVERYEPARQRPAVEAPVSIGCETPARPRVHPRPAFTSRIREASTAPPPRRLFLLHRALLH
ncbi:hypothetical protein [Vitiosangium sp. GDMCC 1.1324]|uniref:hypothetical protein n=1 Tax=Vitiosangium sp. (strain GDMCC 1.1324) TaxID=2138576 RepID=UPI000D3C015D|nr:hypothetical protein [Vitiosangium sp. GDMCC 1.1324]PTL79145.1 hypothetical protein DAT35_36700 [Vitiosangium sp. GDMCC 1.1324]